VIGRGLPAFRLYQAQGILRVHSTIHQYGTGQQDAAAYAVLTMDEDTASLCDTFVYPGGTLLQLLNGERVCIGGGQVEQFDMLFGHSLSIITVF